MRKKDSKNIKDFYKNLFPDDVNDELVSDINNLKEKGLIDQEENKKTLDQIALDVPNFVFRLA